MVVRKFNKKEQKVRIFVDEQKLNELNSKFKKILTIGKLNLNEREKDYH